MTRTRPDDKIVPMTDRSTSAHHRRPASEILRGPVRPAGPCGDRLFGHAAGRRGRSVSAAGEVCRAHGCESLNLSPDATTSGQHPRLRTEPLISGRCSVRSSRRSAMSTVTGSTRPDGTGTWSPSFYDWSTSTRNGGRLHLPGHVGIALRQRWGILDRTCAAAIRVVTEPDPLVAVEDRLRFAMNAVRPSAMSGYPGSHEGPRVSRPIDSCRVLASAVARHRSIEPMARRGIAASSSQVERRCLSSGWARLAHQPRLNAPDR